MPQDRCPGHHVDVAPAELEPELPAEIEKVPVFCVKRELLDAFQVVVLLLPFLEVGFDLRYLIAMGVCALDDVKFPPGRIEMRSA